MLDLWSNESFENSPAKILAYSHTCSREFKNFSLSKSITTSLVAEAVLWFDQN